MEGNKIISQRRSITEIRTAYNEYWDKVWYCRHKNIMEQIALGEHAPLEPKLLQTATNAALRLEYKYGIDNLQHDEFECGLQLGRLSALSWVMGSEWDESMDT